jgi:tripartite-type tricarboxylate transporter receptor subunit TctC
MLFDGFPSSLPHIREGRIRPLAMCGSERSASLPDLPTMAEAGVTGYDAGTWQGLFGPRGMPASVIERIAEAARVAAASASYRERVFRAGAEAVATSGRAFVDIVAHETETWGAVIRASNITASE